MKRMICFALTAVLASGTSLQAATLFYDFGDGAANRTTPGNYNNIIVSNPATLSIADSVDSTGASTGISIEASGFFAGSNQSGPGVAGGDAAAIFESTAYVDNAFGHTGTFGTNPLTPMGTVTLGGLDGSGATTYDFTIFASRTGATDNRETKYDFAGANSGVAYLDTANNLSEVVNVNGIVPTAGGVITLQVSPGPNNTNSSGFYYLGAMRVVSNVIPEPASIGLMCVAACGLLTTRRFA